MREGQQGVTLRTFESMYFQKKLVTDNQAIAHYQFYHSENIFLLQERDLDELPEFLHTPFQPIPSELLEFLMQKIGQNVFSLLTPLFMNNMNTIFPLLKINKSANQS